MEKRRSSVVMLITCRICRRQVDCGDAPAGTKVVCPCGGTLTVQKTPAEAGSLRCPACGAPVDPVLGRCSYCASKLATIICPHCFGTIYMGERHCSHCGEQISERLHMQIGEETLHSCPRCREHPALFVHTVFGYPLERCLACDGLWVDRETIERVYTERASQDLVKQKISENNRAVVKQTIAAGTEGYVPCPVCHKFMHRKNFGQISGVVIDQCKDHGTWFDADELSKILLFISTGGLDKAAERDRERMRDQLRKLNPKNGAEPDSAFSYDLSAVAQDLDEKSLINVFLGKVLKGLIE